MSKFYNVFKDKYWKNDKGQWHREDGPAIERADGIKLWYINGQCHRLEGPAIEVASGSKSWYINGLLYDDISLINLSISCNWVIR